MLPQTSAPAPSTTGLGSSLKQRQLTMMGLGSAIGAGLFLGSGEGIMTAGPAVLISYLVAGTMIILVMWALGEMAAANPNSGAFSVYAEKAMGKVAGSTVGWLWWLQLVVVIAAEALGASQLLVSIWPVLPAWVLTLIFMVVFTTINLTSVKNYGEFEFWFALLKVAAIVLFILFGIALLLGLVPGATSPGLGNLVNHGGFAPTGMAGISTALFVVAFAFGGTEIVAVAAAETADPARSVTVAIRTVVWRILVFYVGSIFIITAVLPWTSEALSSPFAGVLNVAGLPWAGTAITLVAVAALLSALNANLYGASRMIHSLSERREAPSVFARTNKRAVPVAAVVVSVAFGFITVVWEMLYPDTVLKVLLNLVGSTCLVVWGMALLSQLILRRRADRDGTELPLRMRGFPYLTIAGLVLLLAIFVVGFSDPVSRTQLLSSFTLIAGIAVLNMIAQLRKRKRASSQL
ncbi:amino acid permease [Arthrobacter sp. TWP1-1]|uniref:amino acid permease n=1 Tax=Arthrobacter sp. TWP1-1 TaxID=2804568 RepID=UPI003CF53368